MRKPGFGPLITAMILGFIGLVIPTSTLNGLVPTTKPTIAKMAGSLSVDKFKNVTLLQQAFQTNKVLPFFGSSTIGIFSRYHPSNYFPEDKLVPYLEGEPGCTGIIHVMEFASLSGDLKGKKLVYMLDPSDFMNKNGISESWFDRYYAPYQGYRFLFNKEISEQYKQKAAPRLLRYHQIKDDSLLSAELEGYVSNGTWDKVKAELLMPIAYLRMQIMEKQDFFESLSLQQNSKPFKQQPVPRNLSWEQLTGMAEKEGATQAGNNPFGLLNSIYKKDEKRFDSSKNTWKPNDYLHSPEYDDLQAILDMFRVEKADPIFVLIPRKGDYSDFIGFNKTYREQLDEKISNQVKSAGFPVLDYSSEEYDKYFMRDPNHIGWSGWVYLDKDLMAYEHLDESERVVQSK